MREESERDDKRFSIGQRLLPNIYIEGEIGQVDKHVLKNVTRVERFIQDVTRESIVEELVFPNSDLATLGHISSLVDNLQLYAPRRGCIL